MNLNFLNSISDRMGTCFNKEQMLIVVANITNTGHLVNWNAMHNRLNGRGELCITSKDALAEDTYAGSVFAYLHVVSRQAQANIVR